MSTFKIQSARTDMKMAFSSIEGDYFTVRLISDRVSATRKVWGYTDSYLLADLFEWLASQERPWADRQSWESLEGELKVSAACSSLGAVTFEVELSEYGTAEEWHVSTQICAEFGQLPAYAKQVRKFFGKSPS